MQNNNSTNPDNQPNQNSTRASRQAKTPAERTDEAGYQKLPHAYRPLAGRAQRDPLDYDSHPYPSMRRFAEFLALQFDAPRTSQTILRMIRHTPTARMPGFFRSQGRSHGASCPRVVKTMPFDAPSGLESFLSLNAAGKSTLYRIGRDTEVVAQTALRPLATVALQTQNASAFAEATADK